jgi:chemotaxis family two-component system response regulator Rcp1
MSLNQSNPINLLLVDDDPGDVDLTLEVMSLSKLKLNINVVEDGVKAISYLQKEGIYREATSPDLILLDLNMPRKNGREVLDFIKNDDTLKTIPVVILTTSDNEEDIERTYELGASCYITKPVGLKEFQKVVKAFDEFWFTVVKFPKTASNTLIS